MIQRIQTIFWLMGAISIALLFVAPIANLTGSMDLEFWLNGFYSSGSEEYVRPTWVLGVLASIIILISLLTISLFKKRELQMRLTIFNTILIVGLIGLGVFFALNAANDFDCTLKTEYYSVMPLVAIIFNLLAWRGTRKDYLMLKAVDRIR